MGTSVNQSSPRTLNWAAAQAGYLSVEVPIPRIALEVWLAASNQEAGDLARLITQPIVARLGLMASQAKSAPELTMAIARALAESKQSTLGTDIARRAALRCIGTPDRIEAYTAGVFSEATAYLLARDLPGFVGSGRAHTVVDSMEFKAQIMGHVEGIARSVGRPKSLDAKNWRAVVDKVLKRLRGSPE
jgi:hypothetical protein